MSELSDIADSVTSQFNLIVKLITIGAYVAGAALLLYGLYLCFKKKKKPSICSRVLGVLFVLVGIALLCLPSLLAVQ